MLVAKKWNKEICSFEDYELPKGAKYFSNYPDTPCVCANCGKPMLYEDGFTSREIVTSHGFGYNICEKCYKEEAAHAFKTNAERGKLAHRKRR